MNKTLRTTITLVILLAMTVICVSADAEYSSKNDPLVSLSYVDDILAPELMENLMSRVDAEYVKKSEIKIPADTSYTYLTLSKGQTLMAKGICEIVTLDENGIAVITSSANIKASEGLVDVTGGAVVVNGQTVPANHNVVIPKADGRGIAAVNGATNILIRGEYDIAG